MQGFHPACLVRSVPAAAIEPQGLGQSHGLGQLHGGCLQDPGAPLFSEQMLKAMILLAPAAVCFLTLPRIWSIGAAMPTVITFIAMVWRPLHSKAVRNKLQWLLPCC